MKRKLLLIGVGLVLIFLSVLPFVRSEEKFNLDESIRSKEAGQFIKLSRGIVHYELSGPEKGKLVVLVHGFSTPYFIWDSVTDFLHESGYRVLRFDLYGRGYSDRPDMVYNLDLFRSQLEDLLDSLHITESFDIMGLSMGGPIVASYTGKNPNRVKKVILIDPFSEKADIFPLGVPILGEYLNTVVYLPSLPKGISKDFVDPSKVPVDWVVKYKVQLGFKGFGNAILSTLRNLISQDPKPYFEELASTKKPILLFWGEEDRTTPIKTSVYLRELIRPEFVLIKKAGHLPHIEKPEEVLPAISKFLSK